MQPVIPITLSQGLEAHRPDHHSVPQQPDAGGEQVGGIGDIQLQSSSSPAHTRKAHLGRRSACSPCRPRPIRCCAPAPGPSVRRRWLLTMPGHWVIGVLINQLWTFADNGGAAEVNQFVVQPFINYNFGDGWASRLVRSSRRTGSALGQAVDGAARAGHLQDHGLQPAPDERSAVQYYYNVVHPDSGPSEPVPHRPSRSCTRPPQAGRRRSSRAETGPVRRVRHRPLPVPASLRGSCRPVTSRGVGRRAASRCWWRGCHWSSWPRSGPRHRHRQRVAPGGFRGLCPLPRGRAPAGDRRGAGGAWLHRVLDHFVDRALVPPEDEPRFEAFLDSTRRLLDSRSCSS